MPPQAMPSFERKKVIEHTSAIQPHKETVDPETDPYSLTDDEEKEEENEGWILDRDSAAAWHGRATGRVFRIPVVITFRFHFGSGPKFLGL